MGYDEYYQQDNYFGDASPELIAYFEEIAEKGRLLDLGCGQGRDAIPLARMGFTVTAIDASEVGIRQINEFAQSEGLPLTGKVGDMYRFGGFDAFDFILLDSMFHFAKADREKEIAFLDRLLAEMRPGSVVVVSIQDTGSKVTILKERIAQSGHCQLLEVQRFNYTFQDHESGHRSVSPYKLIAARRIAGQ